MEKKIVISRSPTSVQKMDAYPDSLQGEWQFPVREIKFPVSLCRELAANQLKDCDKSGGEFANSAQNGDYSLFFPCKTGNAGQRRVRSGLVAAPQSHSGLFWVVSKAL